MAQTKESAGVGYAMPFDMVVASYTTRCGKKYTSKIFLRQSLGTNNWLKYSSPNIFAKEVWS